MMPQGRVGVTVTRTERHRGCSLTLGSTGLLQSPQPSGKLVGFLTLCPHLLWRPDVPNSFRGLGSWTGLTVSVSASPAPQPLKASTWLSSDPAAFWCLSQAGLCPLGTSQGPLGTSQGPLATGAGRQQVSTTGASGADWELRRLLWLQHGQSALCSGESGPLGFFTGADQGCLSQDCLAHAASRPPGPPWDRPSQDRLPAKAESQSLRANQVLFPVHLRGALGLFPQLGFCEHDALGCRHLYKVQISLPLDKYPDVDKYPDKDCSILWQFSFVAF